MNSNQLSVISERFNCRADFCHHSPALKNMSVDHRCADIFVTEEFLHGAYTCPKPQVLGVITVLEQMRGKTMAEGMAQRDMSLVY